MKKLSLAAAAIAYGLTALAPVHAATDAQKKAAMEKWQEKTPEEKAAAEAKMKAKHPRAAEKMTAAPAAPATAASAAK